MTNKKVKKGIILLNEINNENLDNLEYHDKLKFENLQKYVGNTYKTNQGYTVKIIWYMGRNNVQIEFINVSIPYTCTTTLFNLNRGNIYYPYYQNNYGGYLGVGKYKKTSDLRHIYDCWINMLKNSNKYNTVCNEWKNYQNFTDWYLNNDNYSKPGIIYNINKDILQWNELYKIYSPKTCCIIPADLNKVLSVLQVIRDKRNNKDIPIGVLKKDNKFKGSYYAQIYINNKKRISKVTESPMSAYEWYLNKKEESINEYINHYLELNAIDPVICNIIRANPILYPYGLS